MWTVWMGFTTFVVVYELFQMKILGRKYLSSMDNWYDLIIISSSLICSPYLITPMLQVQKCVCSILAMTASSLNMMLFIFRYNIFVMLFCNALKNAVKLLIPYSVLIIGFSFIFHCLYSGPATPSPSSEDSDDDDVNAGFEKFGYSFITIFVMMMGGLDNTANGLGSSITNDYIITMTVISFVVLVMVVMVNLLVGLTVNLSGEFMNYSKAEITKNKIRNLYNMETLLAGLKYVKTAHFSLDPAFSTVIGIHSQYDEELLEIRRDKEAVYAVNQFVNYVRLNLNLWSSFPYHIEAPDTRIIKLHDSLLMLNKLDMENIEDIVHRKRNVQLSHNKE